MPTSVIGFHTGPGGNKTGLGNWIHSANSKGIPVGLKAVDSYGEIFEAVNIGNSYGVQNWLAFRYTKASGKVSREVPNYEANPVTDAALLAAEVVLKLPAEFDKTAVYVELVNEPRGKTNPGDKFYNDMAACDYLGEWCLAAAKYLNGLGYKFVGPSFNSGEPGEPGQPLSDAVKQYAQPGMLKYLAYCAANPDKAALSVHEYIWGGPLLHPALWGRFEAAIAAADNAGIPRTFPVFVTEFGYSPTSAPAYPAAEPALDFYNGLSARFPQLKMAASWTLQDGYDPVDDQVNSWFNYPADRTFPEGPQPAVTHSAFGNTLPGDLPMDTWQQDLWKLAETKKVLAYKKGAALQEAIKADGLQARTNEFLYTRPDGVVLVCRGAIDIGTAELYVYYCFVPDYSTVYRLEEDAGGTPMPTPFSGYDSPVGTAAERATTKIYPGSWFNANGFANRYQFPDGSWHVHTGNDVNNNSPVWDSDNNAPVYAVADGVATYAQLVIKSNGQPSTWGKLVVIEHPDGMFSRYGHLRTMTVTAGQVVKKGQQIGTIGGDEYGMPNHLHVDVSQSGILKSNPVYWPGDNLTAVQQHFADPKKWIETHRGEVVDPPTPPPTGIDMLPYVKGDGRLYEVRNEWGSQQRHQSQTGAGNEFFQTKDGDWEQMFFNDIHIIRDIDTSPGGGRYYRLKEGSAWGSAWIPRKWSVGDVFTRARFVQFFKEAGCVPDAVNSGNVTDTMRFVAKHNSYTFKTGFVLPDVIELEWVNGPERYFYSRGYGLVGWQRLHDDPNTPEWSAISEEHAPGARPDNLRKVIGCL